MADDKTEVDYTKSTARLDLERRLANGFLPDGALQDNTKNDVLNPEKPNASHPGDGNDTSEYRGVSAEYMNYANDTEKPYPFEGVEGDAVKLLSAGVPNVRKSVAPSSEVNTEVGVASAESLNTAVSGEAYSARLVDAEPEAHPSFVAGVEEPAQTPATPATPAPKKSTGRTNS